MSIEALRSQIINTSKLTNELIKSTSYHENLEILLKHCIDMTDAEYGFIASVNLETGISKTFLSYETEDGKTKNLSQKRPPLSASEIVAVSTQKPLIIKNSMLIPITISEDDPGYIGIVTTKKSFTEDDLNIAIMYRELALFAGTKIDQKEEIKESKERYYSLFQQLIEGVAILDVVFDKNQVPINFKFAQVNPAFEKIISLKSNTIINKSIFDFFDFKHETWNKKINEAITTNRPVLFDMYVLEASKHLEIRIYFQAPRHIACLIKDITPDKNLEQEKEDLHKQLLFTSRLSSLGQLSLSMMNEINNPLSIISGNIELLKSSHNETLETNNELASNIAKINSASLRIEEIIGLVKSHILHDSEILEIVDIHKEIESVITLIEQIYKKDGIIIYKNFHDQSIFVEGNAGKIQQVIMNLLSNAKDATKHLEKRIITISTITRQEQALITVSDNGHGIRQEHAGNIFQPFFTTKDLGDGAGLGLSVSMQIIKAMKGELSFDSELNKGASFIIKVPTVKKKEESIPSDPEDDESSFENTLSGTALIIEDDVHIRTLLVDYLESFGLSVDEAKDGEEGLEKCEANQYDYVLTDLTMPNMTGRDFLKNMGQRKNLNCKIFVITGISNPHLKGLPVEGVLYKPFNRAATYKLLTKGF